eukprot:g10499.t1
MMVGSDTKAVLGLVSLMGLLLLTWPGMLYHYSRNDLGTGGMPESLGEASTGDHQLHPESSRNLGHVMHPHPFPDAHGVPFGAVYGPTSLDSEEVYEAKLAVPGKVAQRLFGASHPYRRMMEDKCGVAAVRGTGGPPDTDAMVVTLKGARLEVEYCRAEMRDMVVNTELGRVLNRRAMYRRYDGSRNEEHLSVPGDILAMLRADGGLMIQEAEFLTGAIIQVSDQPDPEDPTARLVTVSGETYDVAVDGRKELRNLLKMEMEAAVDRLTPGVWQIVSMRIDPEAAPFVVGEDGSVIIDVVNRTGCRVQFTGMVKESHTAQQRVLITGPGDKPHQARREIERLVRKGESEKPQRVYDGLAAQNRQDVKVAQQHYEELKVAQQQYKELKVAQGGRKGLGGA